MVEVLLGKDRREKCLSILKEFMISIGKTGNYLKGNVAIILVGSLREVYILTGVVERTMVWESENSLV